MVTSSETLVLPECQKVFSFQVFSNLRVEGMRHGNTIQSAKVGMISILRLIHPVAQPKGFSRHGHVHNVCQPVLIGTAHACIEGFQNGELSKIFFERLRPPLSAGSWP